jgi:hypothetical protein
MEEYLKFVNVQDKEMENFVEEREKLCQVHEESIAAMRLRHLAKLMEEEVAMEKKFGENLAKLMEKYSPAHQ